MNRNYDGLLIDLDGTMYHGKHMIPGADELVKVLKDQQIPYLYVTNNSSRTAEEVAENLNKMGIEASPEDVCTSSQAAAEYIAEESPDARVAMLGEEGLRKALLGADLQVVEENPDVVIQGIYLSFNYPKLTAAVRWINAGAQYILTNPDLLLPSDDGFIPGAGTLSAAIQAGTGVQPIIIGKPSSHLMNYAIRRLGIPSQNIAVIGDNLRTDIAAGKAAGCESVLVLTGVTTEDNLDSHIKATGVEPDHVCRDLHELIQLIAVT